MTNLMRPRIPQIVRRPDLVAMTSKGLYTALGAAGWFVWLHMLSPLAAALAWWFGYRRFEAYVVADAVRTEHTLRLYGFAVGAAGGLFILWSLYNWFRFRGRDRRRAPTSASPVEIGHAFSIAEETVLAAQRGKIVIFDFDEDGRILEVKVIRAAGSGDGAEDDHTGVQAAEGHSRPDPSSPQSPGGR